MVTVNTMSHRMCLLFVVCFCVRIVVVVDPLWVKVHSHFSVNVYVCVCVKL